MTNVNSPTAPAIRLANAPCSWGVLEFDLPGKALGCAQVLDEIRDTGYVGTELGDWGFMPTDPPALRHELDARGLAMVGAFVPVAFANIEAHAAGEVRRSRPRGCSPPWRAAHPSLCSPMTMAKTRCEPRRPGVLLPPMV